MQVFHIEYVTGKGALHAVRMTEAEATMVAVSYVNNALERAGLDANAQSFNWQKKLAKVNRALATDSLSVAIHEVDMPLTAPELQEHQNVRRMFDVSTAHLSADAMAWLADCSRRNLEASASNDLSGAGPMSTCGATLHGWFMAALPVPGMPDDLSLIWQTAQANGCGYILFDADGPHCDMLPVLHPDEAPDAEPVEPAEPPTVEPIPAYVIPADTPIHYTASGRSKLAARGQAVVDKAALDALLAAAMALLPDIQSEVEQRRDGGNDEEFEELGNRLTALQDALRAFGQPVDGSDPIAHAVMLTAGHPAPVQHDSRMGA